MPAWNASANELFLQARDLPSAEERCAFLDQACTGNAELCRQVEALLAACDNAGSFLEKPAVLHIACVCGKSLKVNGKLVGKKIKCPACGAMQIVKASADVEPGTQAYTPAREGAVAPLANASGSEREGRGSRIGPYKLLQEIGEGGMGTVFMAEQLEPVRRKVAFKVIKAGMDSAEVMARFEAERQAIALMDHPNIAKVLDAGTTKDGRPYFVMELVKGIPITKYCDENHLTPKQRLELFVPVCKAIQHAHQKGIIHRDIKPSNVLVASYDGKPVPKVIDFGIAKATGQKLTDKTMFTAFGGILGTLEYMSPEQAEFNAQDIDSRSDIYSLGVLLYELLTGTTPLTRQQLKKGAMTEALRLIREEEPPKPSTRLSTADGLPSIAAQRKCEPAKLTRLMRGEMDWMVMKALEKDRARRYETANAFARDIERYLHDEPVEAGAPSAGYRLRKFARKYRTPLRVAGLFVVLLAVGTVMSAWQAVRATAERDRAVQAETDKGRERDRAVQAEQKAREALVGLQEEKLTSDRLRYVSDMRLAGYAGEKDDFPRVQELLAFHLPQRPDDIDRRGFEWYYWDRVGRTGELRTLKGHTSVVWGVAFSPDGQRLASASWDTTVRIWDPVTAQSTLTLKGHGQSALTVAFNPNGKQLASGSLDNTVKIWDSVKGAELFTLTGHTARVQRVAFSPDGQRLASCSWDKTVKIWNPVTGQGLSTIQAHSTYVNGVAFSPDGRWLASGSKDKTVKIWDAATGQLLRTLTGHGDTVTMVAFSPDGLWLASASYDRTVKIWDPATGQGLRTLKGHDNLVLYVAFSPDGLWLASASYDRTVKIWDPATGQGLRTLRGHVDEVSAIAFSPDGRRLASASGDHTAKIWDPAKGEQRMEKLTRLKGHTGLVWSVAFSPDGQRLASASEDKTVKIWDLATSKQPLTLKGPERFRSVAFSPDGRQLAAGSADDEDKGIITIWNLATNQELLTLKGQTTGCVETLAFSPDGRRLASASYQNSFELWDLATGQKLRTLNGHADRVVRVAFSPDGRFLASGSLDDTAKIWDAATGKELHTLNAHGGGVRSVAFSGDGQRLATAGVDNAVKLWDLATGQELLVFKGHSMMVNSVVFSPDGHRVASASLDKTVKLWDVATGQELPIPQAHTGEVHSAAFSPNGKRLAAASFDKTITIWDASPREQATSDVMPAAGKAKDAKK